MRSAISEACSTESTTAWKAKDVFEANLLDGKRALVTGATSGIGEAIARRLTQVGAHVMLHGRNAEVGMRLADELGGSFVAADLRDPAAPETIVASLGGDGLDILVNNAGYEVTMDIADLERDVFATLLEVNLLAPTELMRLCLPRLAAARGSIINVSSIHDTVPVAHNSAYAASKAALLAMTKTASVEMGPLGVRVNSIAPGAVRTHMNTQLIDDIGDDVFASWIPLGRVGTVGEIANVAVFLASELSAYVTGASYVVDGGYSNHLVRYPDSAEAAER